jgi:hypothetical protein
MGVAMLDAGYWMTGVLMAKLSIGAALAHYLVSSTA